MTWAQASATVAALYGDLLTGDDHPERLAGPYAQQPAI
jgi:hypothetical protein